MTDEKEHLKIDEVSGNAMNEIYKYEIIQELRVFGNNTWKRIKEISNNISRENLSEIEIEKRYGWKVGDKKSIKIGDKNYDVRIIGFNHDDKVSGGKAGITLQMVDLLDNTYQMNDSYSSLQFDIFEFYGIYISNEGGWNKSKMRTKTMIEIKKSMENELQNVIEKVKKKSANGGDLNYSRIDTTEDELFLLSGVELFGNKLTIDNDLGWACYGEDEGKQYSYWSKHELYTIDDGWNYYKDMIKNYKGNSYWWWLRSVGLHSDGFCSITRYGNTNVSTASSFGGVCVSFCV